MIEEILKNFKSYFHAERYKDGQFGYGFRITCADTGREPIFGFMSATKTIKMVTPKDANVGDLIGITINSFTPMTAAIVATIYMMFSLEFLRSQPNNNMLSKLSIPNGFGCTMNIKRRKTEWKNIPVTVHDKDGNMIKSDMFEDVGNSALYSLDLLKPDAELEGVFSGPIILSLVHFWVKNGQQVSVNYKVKKIELHPYKLTSNPLFDLPPKKV